MLRRWRPLSVNKAATRRCRAGERGRHFYLDALLAGWQSCADRLHTRSHIRLQQVSYVICAESQARARTRMSSNSVPWSTLTNSAS